jgi:hypothetical protein
MLIDIDQPRLTFGSCLSRWQNLYPQLPDNIQGPNAQGMISKTSFDSWLKIINSQLEFLAKTKHVDEGLWALNGANLISNISNLDQYFQQSINNGPAWLAANSSQAFSMAWSIRSALAWLLPAEYALDDIKLYKKADISTKLQLIENLHRELLSVQQKADGWLGRESEVNRLVDEAAQKIAVADNSLSDALTKARDHVHAAEAAKKAAEEALAALRAGQIEQQELLIRLVEIQTKADQALEGASQLGLAQAFSERRKKLDSALSGWAYAFFGGISLLVAASILIVVGVFHLPPLVDVKGTADYLAFGPRLLLTAPFVWFTWFAARQYGLTQRLIEDYAFKEAVALAFRGYSREIGNDEVLLHDLRAKAIHSFGANPAELLPNSNHSSPVQEMLEKALGKLEPTELIKAIKEMRADKSKA